MNNRVILLALCVLLLLSSVQAQFTPAWLENNVRHLSYGPLAWFIPGISKFWYVALMAHSYLALMAGFGRQDKVVQWFNDLTLLYLPMTGVQKAGVLSSP